MAKLKPFQDITNEKTGEEWIYSETVKNHFFNPRNFLFEEPMETFNAYGAVGSPACGDIMHIWLKINPTTERITDFKWKTFGCASAIAATSMFSVMVTENGGLTVEEALSIKPKDIIERLEGLPDRKIHCSVLADKAFRKAINNWFRDTDQRHRIKRDGAKIVDEQLDITDKEIEEAVLDGARTLEDLQKKLKVGMGSPEAIPEIEQLIRFYTEKHYDNIDNERA